MTAAVPAHSFEEVVVDLLWRPELSPGPAALSREQVAVRLQQVQRQRARLAAEEAGLVLRLAERTPDAHDPAPGTAGARKEGGWSSGAELPGVSEFFPAELSMVLNCGRGTAAWRARRAWVWITRLPATFAALTRGEIDERRAQELFDALQHADPDLARRVDAAVLPAATSLTLGALRRRALELLLELDPDFAEENRAQAVKDADVFVSPRTDGVATLGADLPADEAAEAYSLIDSLAGMAKTDGDTRPIRQIRTEIFSLLLRRPGTPWPPVAAHLTVTATLDALEGGSSTPGDVAGFAITPAHLRALLARVGALGLQTPEGGALTFALTGDDGRLLATVDLAELQRLCRRGKGLNPPPATDGYTPTDRQQTFVRVRDRRCRFPNCGQRVGWADLDHVLPHGCGGPTDCANLCYLCRSHHRVKTFARGWRFVLDPDGTLHVTTPSGVTRTTWPPGLRPAAGPPPAEPATPPPTDPDDDLPPF